MAKAIKNIAFIIILAVLVMPGLQNLTGFLPEKSLMGDFEESVRPALNWDNWLSGDFQELADPFIEQNLGFHNTLVRLNNQLDFTLFGKANAEGVVAGKEGIVYETDYIRAYLGEDFMGRRFLGEKLKRLKYLQEFLLREKNIQFTLIFEPSKARMMPEFFPQRYQYAQKDISNYDYAVRLSQDLGIEFLDFNKYYRELESTAKYPLYPPFGIHWSIYGMTFCADSLISYIQSRFPFPLREYSYQLEVSNRPRRTDNDIEKTMNLLLPLPSPELAYPEYYFSPVLPEERPDVLVVGDSYYWNIYNTRIPEKIFREEAFWYFNSLVYPDQYTGERSVEELDLKKEIEKRDFLILMVTERFLYKFDWTFIDMLFDLYASDIMKYPEYEKINNITRNSLWFDSLVIHSIVMNKDLESLLWEDAYYQYLGQDYLDFMIQYGLERQMQIIREDTGWFSYIQTKASTSGNDTESVLRADADFTFKQNFPELHEIYHTVKEIQSDLAAYPNLKAMADSLSEVYHQPVSRFSHRLARHGYRLKKISEIKIAIRNDPDWFRHIQEKASLNNISVERMMHLDAVYIYEKEWEEIREKYGKTK